MSIHTIALLIFLAVFYCFFFYIAIKSGLRKFWKECKELKKMNECPCSHPCNEHCYNMMEENLPGQIIKNK